MILKDKLNRNIDKPYDMILSNVKHDYRISGDAYRLYVTLFTWEDNGTPNEKGLAKQFGVSIQKIKRWIKELKNYGYLTIVGSKSGGYVWTVYKKSQGVVDTKIKGIKFKPKKLNYKNKTNVSDLIPLNNKTNVSDLIPLKVSNLIPIIKDKSLRPDAGDLPNKCFSKNEEDFDSFFDND